MPKPEVEYGGNHIFEFCLFPWEELGPHVLHNVAWAEAYLRTNWHSNPSNRLAKRRQRHRQTGQTDRHRSDRIGRTVLQTVAQRGSYRSTDQRTGVPFIVSAMTASLRAISWIHRWHYLLTSGVTFTHLYRWRQHVSRCTAVHIGRWKSVIRY